MTCRAGCTGGKGGGPPDTEVAVLVDLSVGNTADFDRNDAAFQINAAAFAADTTGIVSRFVQYRRVVIGRVGIGNGKPGLDIELPGWVLIIHKY